MKHLTSEQRCEIYLGRKGDWSRSRISREIGVSTSTVSRELTRNVNSNGEYVWFNARAKSEAHEHNMMNKLEKYCIEEI
jgi:IS30 family transposase